MLSIIKSMSLSGLDGYLIYVQVDVASGMPGWEIVGLPDVSVKESKERVKTAIKNSGYELQSRKIVVNLAPADTRKEGSFFDLPIAIGILVCIEAIKQKNLDNIAFVGELSLDGKLNKINGILPICIEAQRLGIKKIIIPIENLKEASVVANIEILGAKNLKQVVSYLNEDKFEQEYIKDDDDTKIDKIKYYQQVQVKINSYLKPLHFIRLEIFNYFRFLIFIL